jgi:hypothetical protein
MRYVYCTLKNDRWSDVAGMFLGSSSSLLSPMQAPFFEIYLGVAITPRVAESPTSDLLIIICCTESTR